MLQNQTCILAIWTQWSLEERNCFFGLFGGKRCFSRTIEKFSAFVSREAAFEIVSLTDNFVILLFPFLLLLLLLFLPIVEDSSKNCVYTNFSITIEVSSLVQSWTRECNEKGRYLKISYEIFFTCRKRYSYFYLLMQRFFFNLFPSCDPISWYIQNNSPSSRMMERKIQNK